MTDITTEVPAWLNLDAIFTPEDRTRIGELAASLDCVLAELTRFLVEGFSDYRRLSDQSFPKGWPDGTSDGIGNFVGVDALDDRLLLAGWLVGAMTESEPTEEHGADLARRYLTGDTLVAIDALPHRATLRRLAQEAAERGHDFGDDVPSLLASDEVGA